MHYLDHAATTPMLPEAVTAVAEALGQVGNPSSLHGAGRAARRRVEESRELLAESVGARPSEVVFTAGGTEADNLAIKGMFWARRAADPARRRVVVSSVEHHAVLDTVEWLVEHEGAEVTYLPVDGQGRVTPDVVRAALAGDDVALVSVMWANNEVGTVMPITAITAVAAEFGVPVHSDAVQAVGSLPVDFAASGLDALSLTGHKHGGPVGSGALLLRRDAACVPVLHGGGQERDVRSGTLDTAGVVGLSVATSLAARRRDETVARVGALRDRLVDGVRARVPDVRVNGGGAERLPGHANLSFPGCEGDALLMLLDAAGIACSTGSACSAGVSQPSHVLLAMGLSEADAVGSLRFSLGHDSTDDDVDAVLDAIGPAVERARRAGVPTAAAS
ncbi:cysteine desulfurase family protein [Jatrophihabitans endophyticus]|uniref:cysteine desulfurase family protein n=1 Tax=Jatrophihabitans endophyticus TaxID=1206085 RepID=UPI0019F7CAEF|nr:cysteine desulfurase family protein [Jatrophihabitans endophyticus]MBE7188890.1 cysteine desulfurase [Jatrophihabitans endophyticus]